MKHEHEHEHEHEHDVTTDEDGIETLLREVGARDEPSSEAADEVRRAVHAQWRATVALQRRQRRLVMFGVAASLALFAVVASWTFRLVVPVSNIAVTIAHIDGDSSLQLAPRRVKNVGDTMAVGDVLTTDESTRVALAYGARTSVRIDRDTTVERLAPDRFRLSRGAIYVDAYPQAQDQELVIQTRAGDVRHLGTQYQIRQSNEGVEIAAREGRVEIERQAGSALVSAGERVRISAAGRIERDAISAQDPFWDWAESASPVFAIDNRTLAEFLEWAARETGRRVVYASQAAQDAAETLRLRGSIEGLDPETALSAVLSTTEFKRYDNGGDWIGIQLGRSED